MTHHASPGGTPRAASNEIRLEKLWTRMNERGDFPMLSQSMLATVAAMNHDDLDLTELVQLVLSDFALTQKVLRLANSAMYMAFGGNITTVTRALMVLGIDAVGHLVVGLKLVDHFHQNASKRIDAKLELSRTMLAGALARKLTEHGDVCAGEEAVVCTLMRQVGRLLVLFYLEAEWEQINRAMEAGIDENTACVAALGVSFDEIALEAACRWRLPHMIRSGMLPFGANDCDAETGDADPATQQVRWLQAVTNFSTAVSRALTRADGSTDAEECLREIAQHYCDALGDDVDRMVGMSLELAREDAGGKTIREIAELRASAAAISHGGTDPQARIAAGVADLRSLPGENPFASALALASETVFAGLNFARVVVFARHAVRSVFEARLALGLGARSEESLAKLRFAEAFEADVFHLAITSPVGIFIEDAHEPKMRARLPLWYRRTLGDARAFVLLPVLADGVCIALIYGDWADAHTSRRITPREMSGLNELARELGRFFRHPVDRPVETP